MDIALVVVGAVATGFFLNTLNPPVVQNGQFTGNQHMFQQTKSPVNRQAVLGYTADYDSETGHPIVWTVYANGTREKNFCDSKGNPPPLPSNQ